MGAPWHNRQNWTDVIESGRYIVPTDKAIFIGEPLKLNGSQSGSVSGMPAYDGFWKVEGYTDATGEERCVGVSDDEIINFDSLPDSVKNIEWRHGRRDVAIVMHGDRTMVNKHSGWTGQTGDIVAPAPGGFQKWTTGKVELGKIKEGPIEYNKRGLIMIDNKVVPA